MFLGRRYRDRAIGLIGAYAILIGGVVATGAFDEPAHADGASMRATEALLERKKLARAEDFSAVLHGMCDVVCLGVEGA